MFATIAGQVGVSPRTVRRVLTGNVRDARPTILRRARRIQDLARQYGYQHLPNAAARATVTGRFQAIGLLMSRVAGHSYLPPGLLNGLQEQLVARDLLLTMSRLPDHTLIDDAFVPRILREWAVDGFLINYNHHIPQRLIDLIDGHKIPSVWINADRDHDTVLPDELEASRRLATRLLELGHRRVAFARLSSSAHYSQAERHAGLEQVFAAAGHPLRTITIEPADPPASPHALHDAALAVLDRLDGATAVATAYAGEAQALQFAAASRGLRLPQHLSLATFHDQKIDASGVPIAHMYLDQHDIAREAVRLLLARIDGGDAHRPPARIAYQALDPGETLAPPPST